MGEPGGGGLVERLCGFAAREEGSIRAWRLGEPEEEEGEGDCEAKEREAKEREGGLVQDLVGAYRQGPSLLTMSASVYLHTAMAHDGC